MRKTTRRHHRQLFIPLLATQILVALFLILPGTSAHASIAVDRSIIYFLPGQPPRQDLIIFNHGTQKTYIKTEVFEVFNPGTPEEIRRKATSLDEVNLLVSPNKMAIPPKGRKRIRFSYLGDNQKERVFRINITPVMGAIKSKSTALKLVVAYQILLIITPEKAQVMLSAERQDNTILFKNNGNTNVLLTKARFCETQTTPSEKCEPASLSKRIYAGNQWRITLPDSGQFVEFEVVNGSLSTRASQRFPRP